MTSLPLSLVLSLQIAAPPPGGLPEAVSALHGAPFDYSKADPAALEARASALFGELQAAGDTLVRQPTYHFQRSPYLGISPLTTSENEAMAGRLQERIERLGRVVLGDRARVRAVRDELSDTILRRWACAADCQRFDGTIQALRARQGLEEQKLTGRIDAASLEATIAQLQLRYLRAARGMLRVRSRRNQQAPGPKSRPRRGVETEVPAWLKIAIKQENDARIAEAERNRLQAQAEERRLQTLDGNCGRIRELKDASAAYERRIRDAKPALAKAESELKQQTQNDTERKSRLRAMRVESREGTDHSHRFDTLHVELSRDLDDALASIGSHRRALELAQKESGKAEEAVTKAESRIPAAPVSGDPWDPCDKKNASKDKVLELAQYIAAQATVATDSAWHQEKKILEETAAKKLRLAERKAVIARQDLKLVLPYLSDEHREEWYTLDGEYVRRMLRNLALLAVDIGHILRQRLAQLRDLPRVLFSWGGFVTVFSALFWLGLILLIGRGILRRVDAWLILLWEWLKAQRGLQRVLGAAHGLFKLLSVAVRPGIALVTAYYAADYIGWQHPEVLAAYTVLEWVVLYRVLVALTTALFTGPAWSPDRAPALTRALDTAPVLERDSASARLSSRSMRLIIYYFVLRTAVLQTVDLLLGQDYLYDLVGLAVSIAQWALIVVLIVWWRRRVAEAYALLGWAPARPFVAKHGEKLWFSVLVLPMAAEITGRHASQFATELFGESGRLRTLTAFLSRRRIEQAAKKRQARVDSPGASIPESYARQFAPAPLTDQPYALTFCKPVQSITEQYAFWFREKREGSVAIVGDAGMGKTTLLNQVLRALPEDAQRQVIRGRLNHKISTERDVIVFLADLFDFQDVPETLQALEEAILEDTRPIVVIDDAHHFFLKTMGGLEGLDAFVHVVNVTCTNVFWLTAFNAYSWFFIKNLKRSEPPFRTIVHLEPWRTEELEGLVMARSADTGYQTTFQDLVIDTGGGSHAQYEVVKTTRSYFRLLGELTGGNPAVALRYWLSSLRFEPHLATATGRGRPDRVLRVGLYSPDPPKALVDASDEVLFLLTCIAVHASVTPTQLAAILRLRADVVQRMLSYCEENHLIRRVDGVVSLHTDSYFQIVRLLSMRSFIYF